MFDCQFRRVQTEAWRRRPAIQGVAKNWKPMFGGVDADLVRLARQRRGFDHCSGAAEHGFGDDSAGVRRSGHVPGPGADERGAGAQFLKGCPGPCQ